MFGHQNKKARKVIPGFLLFKMVGNRMKKVRLKVAVEKVREVYS
jgi:hypothetical protein